MRRTREYQRASSLVYGAHDSAETMFEAVDSACGHWTPIHGVVFRTVDSTESLLRGLSGERARVRGFSVSADRPCKIEVPIASRTRLGRRGLARGLMWDDRADGTVWLIGLGDEFRHLWGELYKYSRSQIATLYLRTEDYRSTFRLISRNGENVDLGITGYTASVLCDDRQRVKVRREWLPSPKPQSAFFSEFAEERQWLRSAEVVFSRPGLARGSVRRDLHFCCQGGFSVFAKHLVSPLKQIALSRQEVLENRSISASPTHASRPLRITFEHHIFEDKRQNHRLIRILRELPDAALSVFHANPFLHASVVDYSDGSSYKLWITDSSALAIVPQRKATPASLGRLCNHINERFSEGAIEEIAQ